MEVDYSNINVNSDRLEIERKNDTGLEQDLEKFTILMRLQQLQTIDDEARCYRTFVLYEAAKHYGYKLNWPTDALQYANTLFKAKAGHLCTREACQVILLEKRHLYHNGTLLKQLFTHPCNGAPCIECSVRLGEAAPHQQLNHPCVCQRCDQFTLPKGTTFDHPETGKQMTSSGTVFVCCQTGIVHICPEYERCDRTYINTNIRTQGYVCRISGRYKGNSITYIPEFDENRKIATSRIKKMKTAEDEDDENQNYISDEEFDFVENNDEVEETGNPVDEYTSDPRDVRKNRLPGSRDMMSLDPLPGNNDVDESEYDEEVDRPNDLAQRLPGMRRLSDITRLVHTQDIGEIVQRLTTSPKKRKASPQSVPKRQRTPRAKLTPENKVDQYMKNSGDRLQRVQQIVRMLTCNANKITMYREALWDASYEGGERVDSAKRKSTKSELTTSRCRTIWYSYVLPKLPPEPYLADRPLEIQVFVEKILNAWELCANSPLAVETGARKRSALNLPKIAFASLYMIADGGHMCKCSLDPALLGTDTVVDGVNLCKFIVTVLPASRLLPKVIVPREELNTLRSLVRSNISFSGKTEFEGKKLLKQCVLSRHASIHESLINDLALPDIVRVERLREYIVECLKLQC